MIEHCILDPFLFAIVVRNCQNLSWLLRATSLTTGMLLNLLGLKVLLIKCQFTSSWLLSLLFGESFKRGAFMAKLEEEYQEHGFDAKIELADHIPVLLNFLCVLDQNDALANELISECMIPVFKKMNDNFKDDSLNPYVPVLRSVLIVFQGHN